MGQGASAQRLRIGADLRRLRELTGLSGEQVARALGWSQPKVSRIEIGRTSFTVKDVAALLTYYGVAEDVRAELLAATAEDTGEGAWIIRAGGWARRQQSIASLEAVTQGIRQFQPVVVPGLLQTRQYAHGVAAAAGVADPEATADARLRRQEVLSGPDAPTFDVVLDARALLFRTGSPEDAHAQVLSVVERAGRPGVTVRVIPLGAQYPVVAAMGFTIYDFRAAESPRVVWIEPPTGDVYFSDHEDVERYVQLFEQLKGVALDPRPSIEYLMSFADDVERHARNSPRR